MFHIKYNQKAADWYYDKQKPICERRIIRNLKRLNKEKPCPSDVIDYIEYVKTNLKKILIGRPQVLMDIDKELQNKYPGFYKNGLIADSKLHKELNKIFNYRSFSKDRDFAYNFTAKSGVNVCPYCNFEFTFTVKLKNGETVMRPELDHFFPESKYPLFALSFCNLIPSGHLCNCIIKNDKEMHIDTHVHPYIEEKGNDFRFISYMAVENDELKLKLKAKAESGSKAENSINFFRLNDLYQSHISVTEKVNDIFSAYPPEKLEEEVRLLKEMGHDVTKEELLEILYREFIVESPDEEMLGKLRQDMFREISQDYEAE